MMFDNLLTPCTYQGGKGRLAEKIVDRMIQLTGGLETWPQFHDLCCGSGAVTLALLNRGYDPKTICMCDISCWGGFWASIGGGTFELDKFRELLDVVPNDKFGVKPFMIDLSKMNAAIDTVYRFLLLQAASFGGKQVWRDGNEWRHSGFRNYWQPTDTSVRRSPVNPIQPEPDELYRRVELLTRRARGLVCVHADVAEYVNTAMIQSGDVVYLDPPYPNTSGYGFSVNVGSLIQSIIECQPRALFVSLDRPLSDQAVQLHFGGPKGGISGNKAGKGQEWLSVFM